MNHSLEIAFIAIPHSPFPEVRQEEKRIRLRIMDGESKESMEMRERGHFLTRQEFLQEVRQPQLINWKGPQEKE